MLYINVYANRSFGTDIFHFIDDLLRAVKWREAGFGEDFVKNTLPEREKWYDFDGDGTSELWSFSEDWSSVINMVENKEYSLPELKELKNILNTTEIAYYKRVFHPAAFNIIFTNGKKMTIDVEAIWKRHAMD